MGMKSHRSLYHRGMLRYNIFMKGKYEKKSYQRSVSRKRPAEHFHEKREEGSFAPDCKEADSPEERALNSEDAKAQ